MFKTQIWFGEFNIILFLCCVGNLFSALVSNLSVIFGHLTEIFNTIAAFWYVLTLISVGVCYEYIMVIL